MYPNLSLSPIDIFPKRKTTKDIPQNPLARMAAKIYILGSLAWDYADTCCNIAATMRLSHTKKLCRAVRELKLEYDRFRNSSMCDTSLAEETRLGLLFEEICEDHFSKLNYGIDSEKKVAGLSADYKMLVKAVHMAMCIIDTMKLYAVDCDKWIREQGVYGHSILADHFVGLAILLPEFAGDCYNAASDARRITSHILLNEIKRIEIFNEDNG